VLLRLLDCRKNLNLYDYSPSINWLILLSLKINFCICSLYVTVKFNYFSFLLVLIVIAFHLCVVKRIGRQLLKFIQ
jgi:hypothetical protein